MYGKIIISFFVTILSRVVADEGVMPMMEPLPLPEHNDRHFAPVHGEPPVNYQHPEVNFNQGPPPPPFFFQQHPVENGADHLNHDIHTNQIEHGDPMMKMHDEERRLFEEVMHNKFEMDSLHNELAEMHHQLEAMSPAGNTFSAEATHHAAGVHPNADRWPSHLPPPHGVDVNPGAGKTVEVKPKLEGPPIVKHKDDVTSKSDIAKGNEKKLFGDHKDSFLTPLLNSLGEGFGDKGFGHHLVGLASLVPIVLVKIAAKFALVSFSSHGLKALATLIPTIALLLINGIVLFLIWYQNFKARLGEHEIGSLFGHDLTL